MVTWPGCAIMLLIVLGTAFSSATVEASTAGSTVWHAPIAIRGDSGFTPANGVASGSGTPEDPYIVQGWNISVANSPVFFTTGARAGILVENTRAHFVISDVFVHDGPTSSANIVLKNVSNGRVENSSIVRGNIGILLWVTNGSIVSMNHLRGLFDFGVYVSQSHGNMVHGNHILDINRPIIAFESNYNHFLRNTIEQFSYPSTVAGISSLEYNSSFNRFQDNIIRGGYGGLAVAVGSHFNVVSGNTIEHVGASGISVGTGSRGNLVENNTIVDSGWGVLLNQAFETRVRGNWISASVRTSPPGFELFTGKGVWVIRSSHNWVSANIVVAPVGISLCGSRATILGPPNDLTQAGRPVERFCP